jgi:hypothetical protein
MTYTIYRVKSPERQQVTKMTTQKKTEYVVVAGSLTLGRTTDYNEAVRWMRLHDDMKAPGSPYARIEEVA